MATCTMSFPSTSRDGVATTPRATLKSGPKGLRSRRSLDRALAEKTHREVAVEALGFHLDDSEIPLSVRGKDGGGFIGFTICQAH